MEPEEAEALLADQRRDLEEFPRTIRFKELEAYYWRRPHRIELEIQPEWDLRRSALRMNWELDEEEILECSLFLLPKELLLKHLHRPETYYYPRNFLAMEPMNALRVLDHWSRGSALTPPVLTETDEGTWGNATASTG